MLFVWFCVFVSAFTGRFVTEQSPPPGDYIDVPVNRTDVLEAAWFAVDEFNKGPSIYMFNFTIVEITSAKMQVVGGFNYFLEMLLGPATCQTVNAAAIKGNAAPNECPFKASLRYQVVYKTQNYTLKPITGLSPCINVMFNRMH
ncbi:cystatin-C-like [Etheostoma cragini]|uniref:cystatin-C-like n=1 Tax=Etheostoma cragini TaxID=417921 RepID=UPI00155EB89A|nr:cystatin-C-like [Etheostoma cragini]